MPTLIDPNTGALTYDPSIFAVPNLPSRLNQSYAMPSSVGRGDIGQGQGINPLMMQLMNAYAQRQEQQAQAQQIASAANAWGNAQGITPQNQWDARWKLMNDNSPLGVWGRASLRQDYGGGQELSSQAPGAGPYLGTEAQRPKYSGTNWESTPAGGGGIVYSGSQVPQYERGDVKNIDPNYDFYMRNQNAMAGYW